MLCTHKTASSASLVLEICPNFANPYLTQFSSISGGNCITLIKKRKYWPKYIKGDVIKQHFDEKTVGDCDSWKGNMDEVPFHVYAMKEPDYVMSLMSTYGTNLRSGKETCREWVDSDGTKKQQNSTILKWWAITSYTDTLSMTTTINDTHQLAWRLFGAPSTGPTVCFPSCWLSPK